MGDRHPNHWAGRLPPPENLQRTFIYAAAAVAHLGKEEHREQNCDPVCNTR